MCYLLLLVLCGPAVVLLVSAAGTRYKLAGVSFVGGAGSVGSALLTQVTVQGGGVC